MFEALLAMRRKNTVYDFAIFSVLSTTATTDKYHFVTNAVTASAVLGVGAGTSMASLGNRTFGLFAGGNFNTSLKTTRKYTYETEAVSPGTDLRNARDQGAAAGNITLGIITGGKTNSTMIAASDKYTYATGLCTGATALAIPSNLISGTGNSQVGLFGGGSSNGTRLDKYTYSNDSFVATTNLPFAAYGRMTFSSATAGYFMGGTTGSNYPGNAAVYTYANDTNTAAVNLVNNLYYAAGASNNSVGIMGGGSTRRNSTNITIAEVQKLIFPSSTFVAGTNLRSARANISAISGNPGGL